MLILLAMHGPLRLLVLVAKIVTTSKALVTPELVSDFETLWGQWSGSTMEFCHLCFVDNWPVGHCSFLNSSFQYHDNYICFLDFILESIFSSYVSLDWSWPHNLWRGLRRLEGTLPEIQTCDPCVLFPHEAETHSVSIAFRAVVTRSTGSKYPVPSLACLHKAPYYLALCGSSLADQYDGELRRSLRAVR